MCLRLTLATSISRSFAHGLQWVQPNKWDQKGEGRNVNENGCLPYQQTKHAVPSGHQPLPTIISALRRNLSVVGVGNASHCSVLTWKIPWREERGGLQFMVSHRVGYDWACMAEHRLWGLRSTNPGPQLWKHQVLTTRLPRNSCHILRCQLPGCKLCRSTSLFVYLKDARDRFLFFFFIIFFLQVYWDIIDIKYCVSLGCAARWLYTVTYGKMSPTRALTSSIPSHNSHFFFVMRIFMIQSLASFKYTYNEVLWQSLHPGNWHLKMW